MDFEPMYLGFDSRESHDFFFWSLLLQCKFANSTLLSLLSFSYFITPYDAQASSAFSALIIIFTGKPVIKAIVSKALSLKAKKKKKNPYISK